MVKGEENKDLDSFWDELIEKSSWARKNAGKFTKGFRNLEILEGKHVKTPEFVQQNFSNNTKKTINKKLVFLLVFGLLILCLAILTGIKIFLDEKKYEKYNAGILVEDCNKTYAVNSVYTAGECKCLAGYFKEGNICLKENDCAKSGNVYLGANNTCKCATGYIMSDNNKCISYYEDCKQRNGYFDGKFEKQTNKYICECKPNNYWNIEKNICESCAMLFDKKLDVKNQCGVKNNSTTTVRSPNFFNI